LTLVTLAGVGRRFANGTEALAGVDLSIATGEVLAILGASGCGKSTLLRILAGLVPPSAGQVRWPGGRPDSGGLGFVFQDPTLMPWSDAGDNVALPLRLRGTPRKARRVAAEAALTEVGLAGFARAYPRELSGGMRMRVSLARALVTAPSLLLMDEPFAALDEITRHKLNDDLLALHAARAATVVFVTHSVFESVYLAQRIVVMAARPGRIAAELVVDAPWPRPPGFRSSPGYAALCGEVSATLERAMAA